MWNSKYAVPWSDIHYNERDRISHRNRTKQREEKVSWAWEEIMAGDESLPWKQPQAVRGGQQRRKPKRQLNISLGGGGTWSGQRR